MVVVRYRLVVVQRSVELLSVVHGRILIPSGHAK